MRSNNYFWNKKLAQVWLQPMHYIVYTIWKGSRVIMALLDTNIADGATAMDAVVHTSNPESPLY